MNNALELIMEHGRIHPSYQNWINELYREVFSLSTVGDGEADETQLWDWLYKGYYHVGDTPKSIAAEWDSLEWE